MRRVPVNEVAVEGDINLDYINDPLQSRLMRVANRAQGGAMYLFAGQVILQAVSLASRPIMSIQGRSEEDISFVEKGFDSFAHIFAGDLIRGDLSKGLKWSPSVKYSANLIKEWYDYHEITNQSIK